MKLIKITAIIFFLSGCSHTLSLRYDFLGSSSNEGCLFSVKDSRPDPGYIYGKSSSALVRMKIQPDLGYVIKDIVCSNDSISPNGRDMVFIVTDFECMVTGFFKLTYVADIRGKLVFPNGEEDEIRANNTMDTDIAYIPSGCELAAAPIVRDISEKIVDHIESRK